MASRREPSRSIASDYQDLKYMGDGPPASGTEKQMNRAALLAALASLAATPALANDTTAELKTGGLAFTRSEAIEMAEEKLYISPKQVKVDYVFHNTSDTPFETYVAFPMPDIQGYVEYNVDAGNTESDNFLGFTVTQDGKPIETKLQQRAFVAGIDMTDEVAAAGISLNPLNQESRRAIAKLPETTINDWLERGLVMKDVYQDSEGEKSEYAPLWNLKSAYYWKTTFPAGADVKVSHTYRPSVGGTVATTYLEDNEPKGERYEEYKKKFCIDDAFVKLAKKSNAANGEGRAALYENWISYILTTGGNWYGPIKKFTLIVDKGEQDNFVSFCGEGVKKTGPTTFEMTATDFYPERDLDILLLIPSQAP